MNIKSQQSKVPTSIITMMKYSYIIILLFSCFMFDTTTTQAFHIIDGLNQFHSLRRNNSLKTTSKTFSAASDFKHHLSFYPILVASSEKVGHHDYIRDPSDAKNSIHHEKQRIIKDEKVHSDTVINDMLKIRDKAILRKDYDLADEILAELWRDHGVIVLEKEGLWTTRFKTIEGGKSLSSEYKRDPSTDDSHAGCSSGLDLNYFVEDILCIREKALRKRDFQLADEMSDELLRIDYGV